MKKVELDSDETEELMLLFEKIKDNYPDSELITDKIIKLYNKLYNYSIKELKEKFNFK